MRHRAGALTALAVAAALGACGSGGASESAKKFQGEKQDVAKVIEDLESASREGDIKRICKEILAQRVVAQAEQNGRKCEAGGPDLRREVSRYGGKGSYDIEVERVTVTGKDARAQVRYSGGGRSRNDTLLLLKEDGGWRVGLAGGGS